MGKERMITDENFLADITSENEADKVQIFSNETLGSVRTILKDGDPLFCLSDICKVLEIRNSTDIANAIKKEFEDALDLIYPIFDSLGREQKASFITESQMYFVLMRSDKPKAKPFRQWVVNEVLPSIRKTGSYSLQKQLPQTYGEALRALADEVEAKERLALQIQKEKPLVDFAKQIAQTTNAISVRDFSKILHDENIQMGEKKLFAWLRDSNYLMSDNTPYQKFIDSGYFEVREGTFKSPYGEKSYTQTLITGKGQIYFCEKLRRLNIKSSEEEL